MSKTILVEWPGLFSRSIPLVEWPDLSTFLKQRTHSSECCKVLPTKNRFVHMHVFTLPGPQVHFHLPVLHHAAGSAGLPRMRAIMFTNFFGYFSPCFVSAFPRTHPRRSRWGFPVLRHTPFGELHENLAQRWTSSSRILGLGAFQTKNLVRFRKGLPIMQ